HRLVAVVLDVHLVLCVGLEVELHEPREACLVVHQENALLPIHGPPLHGHATMLRRTTVARPPPSGRLRPQRVPPCMATMVLLTARPSPVPLPAILVVKNGSSTLFTCCSGIPVPVSSISTRMTVCPTRSRSLPRTPTSLWPAASWVRRVRTVSVPPSGIASIALM